MVDLKKFRWNKINEYIEEIYIIAKDRTDWWRDQKIQERVMYIRNLWHD